MPADSRQALIAEMAAVLAGARGGAPREKPTTTYHVVTMDGVELLAGPDLHSKPAASRAALRKGEKFEVADEVTGTDGRIYLRLADGRGWAYTFGRGGRADAVAERVDEGAPSERSRERSRSRERRERGPTNLGLVERKVALERADTYQSAFSGAAAALEKAQQAAAQRSSAKQEEVRPFVSAMAPQLATPEPSQVPPQITLAAEQSVLCASEPMSELERRVRAHVPVVEGAGGVLHSAAAPTSTQGAPNGALPQAGQAPGGRTISEAPATMGPSGQAPTGPALSPPLPGGALPGQMVAPAPIVVAPGMQPMMMASTIQQPLMMAPMMQQHPVQPMGLMGGQPMGLMGGAPQPMMVLVQQAPGQAPVLMALQPPAGQPAARPPPGMMLVPDDSTPGAGAPPAAASPPGSPPGMMLVPESQPTQAPKGLMLVPA